MKEMRVNPIIVNYCTPGMTCNCVASILANHIAIPEDIIVVDNASPDGSYAKLMENLPLGVRLIGSLVNGGFGSGVNLGVASANREFVLVLNPDTYFEDCSIDKIYGVFDEYPEVAIVGLNLVYPGGERQYSARRFYSLLDVVGRRLPIGRFWPIKGRIERHLMVKAWVSGLPFEAEWVMGTGFVASRELYLRIGGMDETYFLYMEDVDLCARVWQAGRKVMCVPEARLVHDHQRSSAAGPFSWAGKLHLKSLLRFRSKFRVPLFRQPGIKGLWR